MSDLVQHAFHGQAVRVITDEHGEPWFVASDVAAILGYRMASDLTRRLDDDDKGTRPVRTVTRGEQDMTVITEPGLYVAVFGSQVPGALEFKRWVTHEVIPAIRKTGSYAAPQLSGPELMARALLEAKSTIDAAEAKIAELEPPAKAWNALADATGDYSLRDAAQILSRDPSIEIGQNRLAKMLREIRWIDQRGIPYQVQIDNGRLTSRARSYNHPRTGERVQADPQVRVTGKGLTWLHAHLGGSEALATDRLLEVVS